MIFEGRLSHKSLLFDVTPYIESLYIIWNGIQYEPFYFLPFKLSTNPYFLNFKSPVWKVYVLLLKNNYIGILIIKLWMHNQFQFLNLISFIICYRCPKKYHFAKMGTMTQKMNHLNVHSTYGWRQKQCHFVTLQKYVTHN